MSTRAFMRTCIWLVGLMCSGLVSAACETGNLIGGARYSIENQTSSIQYVFLSADATVGQPTSWKRVSIEPGSVVEVDYAEGEHAILVREGRGPAKAEAYRMTCGKRYLLQTDGVSRVVALRKFPEI